MCFMQKDDILVAICLVFYVLCQTHYILIVFITRKQYQRTQYKGGNEGNMIHFVISKSG